MKKIALLLALSLIMFQCTASIANADAETDLHQVYIAKIQAKQASFSPHGFFEAISNDNKTMVELYLLAGMSPNTTFMAVPALYFAIGTGSENSVQLLINNGAEVNKVQMNYTPLMFAINRKQPQIAKVLIDNGADINATTTNETPINYALKKKQTAIAKMLLNAGAEVDDVTVVRSVKFGDENIKDTVYKKIAK